MPRPVKCRRVCQLPDNELFGPMENSKKKEFINMTLDEYEVIRLIDLEDFTQDQCSQQMGVGRTTVQGIYASARKKIAMSIIEGKILHIKGGEYKLCKGHGKTCGRGCRKIKGDNNEKNYSSK